MTHEQISDQRAKALILLRRHALMMRDPDPDPMAVELLQADTELFLGSCGAGIPDEEPDEGPDPIPPSPGDLLTFRSEQGDMWDAMMIDVTHVKLWLYPNDIACPPPSEERRWSRAYHVNELNRTMHFFGCSTMNAIADWLVRGDRSLATRTINDYQPPVN